MAGRLLQQIFPEVNPDPNTEDNPDPNTEYNPNPNTEYNLNPNPNPFLPRSDREEALLASKKHAAELQTELTKTRKGVSGVGSDFSQTSKPAHMQ